MPPPNNSCLPFGVIFPQQFTNGHVPKQFNFCSTALQFLTCAIFPLHCSLTSSVGKENLKVEYSSRDRIRVWPDLLDRNDGSYLARFRLMETYQNLVISIKFKNEHLASSPYHLKGILLQPFNSNLHSLPNWYSIVLKKFFRLI